MVKSESTTPKLCDVVSHQNYVSPLYMVID